VANNGDGGGGGFQEENARQAQELNRSFANVNEGQACQANDPKFPGCTSDGRFAQCDNGRVVVTACGGGLQCMALPLVNRPGTSVACDTREDGERRIVEAGGSGGLTGGGGGANVASSNNRGNNNNRGASVANVGEDNNNGGGGGGGFQAENARQAQELNRSFADIQEGQSCDGQESRFPACTGDGRFAQCDNKRVVVVACGGGLQCMALPLVRRPGTTVACDNPEDGARRIAEAGGSGGLTGGGGANVASNNSGNNNRGASVANAGEGNNDNNGGGGGFQAENARQAQELNRSFADIQEGQSCDGQESRFPACTGDGRFAQCDNERVVVVACGGGLQCMALPLVRRPGTTVACDTPEGGARRIVEAGGSGGLFG
ncbi:hypothetical protein FRC17_001878, partial [Serendipita sp. 399]